MNLQVDGTEGAFACWLRTGRLPPVRAPNGVELKFNPYHDPTNGQFTFGPGGSSSVSEALRGTRRRLSAGLAAAPAEPISRGGNARAFEDAMTLEQSFPGLRDAPGGAIIAVGDIFFDFTGPATEAEAALLDNWSRQVVADIRRVDPNWVHATLGRATTIQGKINELNDLRWQRAAAIFRVRGDTAPLQVETTRFMQQQADLAYDDAVALLRLGRLMPRLSEREAIGNFVDQRVRRELRNKFASLRIDLAGSGPVRVNRREYDTSGTDLTYRRPDARVGNVAFDVTLTRKTAATPQVRGFFNTDFQPENVVIIRPRQEGAGHTYVISRPGDRR